MCYLVKFDLCACSGKMLVELVGSFLSLASRVGRLPMLNEISLCLSVAIGYCYSSHILLLDIRGFEKGLPSTTLNLFEKA